MNSLLTVTNNVSLVSITVTPSTFLACVILLLFFAALYIPLAPTLRIPRVSLPSTTTTTLLQHSQGQQTITNSRHYRISSSKRLTSSSLQKSLPALPNTGPSSAVDSFWSSSRQLALRDLLTSYWNNNHSNKRTKPTHHHHQQHKQHDQRQHGRRPARSLASGNRSTCQPAMDTAVVSSSQRARDGGGSRRGLGRRFRRWWLLTAGMAEARQRRPQQRLLEGPA
jgi:hypothetical protein